MHELDCAVLICVLIVSLYWLGSKPRSVWTYFLKSSKLMLSEINCASHINGVICTCWCVKNLTSIVNVDQWSIHSFKSENALQTLLELLLLPWNEKRLFRGVKHGKDVISVNYPRKGFHGTFIARINTISVEYHGDNPFPRN
jgi:hypothetical protein